MHFTNGEVLLAFFLLQLESLKQKRHSPWQIRAEDLDIQACSYEIKYIERGMPDFAIKFGAVQTSNCVGGF